MPTHPLQGAGPAGAHLYTWPPWYLWLLTLKEEPGGGLRENQEEGLRENQGAEGEPGGLREN